MCQRVGDRVEVNACTQAPMMDRDEVARVLGLPRESVRIIPYGLRRRLRRQARRLDSADAGRRRLAPESSGALRLRAHRIDDLHHQAPPGRDPGARRLRRRRPPRQLRFDGDFNTGAYASWGPTVAGRVPVHAAGPYRVPHVPQSRPRHLHQRHARRRLPRLRRAAGGHRARGVCSTISPRRPASTASSSAISMRCAPATRRPPARFWKRAPGLPACLDALTAALAGLLAEAAAFNAGARTQRRGIGIGCMWYGIGNTGLSNPSTMRLTLARDGTLTFWNGAVDIGQGSTTVLTQIAADALGLPVSAFQLVVGDTDLTFDAGKTSASRQTFVSGKAAQLAGEALRAKILRLTNAGPNARIEPRRPAPDRLRRRPADGGRSRPAPRPGPTASRSRPSPPSTRPPRRSTPRARASPTPPTVLPPRSPPSMSISASAP